MANIHIKELFGSDNITDLTEKVNFNFDQLILAGGGPEGPIGGTGASGPVGSQGVRGSQWVAGFGATTINLPTDGIYRDNDFLLDDGGSFVSGGATGQVFYYNSTTWVDTGINLRGPKGDTGGAGDGSISILPGLTQIYEGQSAFVPTISELGAFITSLDTSDDEDDYKKPSGNPFINAGVDFIALGRGNNSLVLGRYATLFDTGAVGSKFNPPGSNSVMKDFPTEESDVPMLLVSQNDYKDPDSDTNTYTNGISIGLTKSHPDADYKVNDGMRGVPASYSKYANISIENKHHDLKILSSQMITLSATSNSSFFRLGNTISRTGYNSVDFRSTKLKTEQYTNFKIANSFFTDLSDSGNNTSGNELIHNAQSTFFQNAKFYVSDESGGSDNDIRQEISKTFIGTKNDSSGKIGANELVFFNGDSLTTDSDDKTISKTLDPTTSGSTPSDFNTRSIFDSDNKNFVFRIGQTTVQPGKMIGGTTGEPTLQNGYNNKINITYQGQGYDTPFIQYSGIDIFNTYNNSINSGIYDHYSPYATIPNNSTLEQALGYDIREPLQWNNTNSKEGSLSMTRMGIYPGFFRKDKSSNTYTGDSNARQKKFFDVAHRMMPTGSLDVFGTVRIREQETTNAGAKDGWIAVNKKDGIIGFEEPSQASSTPTFSIIMFPEMASNKFSFYVESGEVFGASSSTGKAYNYVPPILPGATSRPPFAAFPGKGSDELKDYYICNGAVLADSRDCIVTGPFSKMKGMNVSADNGNTKVQNGTLVPSGTPSDYDYEPNPDFIGIDDQTHDSSPQIPAIAGNWSDYVSDFFNAMGSLKDSDGSWGCSILAGELADSKFRIILPNYFGRVAKMQFPDSDSMVRAISGNVLPQDPGIDGGYNATTYPNGQERDSGYIYHKANGKYNASWMMKGMFDSAGFPYLSGSQEPRQILPSHDHEFRGERGVPQGGGNNIFVKSINRNNTDFPRYGGDFRGGLSESSLIDIREYAVSGTGFAGGKFKILKHFSYDTDSGIYSKFSNWISYTKENIAESGQPDTSGQKFITAPFKGTIMAINLKGVRNPNRNNTVIKDLHYVAGVPLCGEISFNEIKADMSWYSFADILKPGGNNAVATNKVYLGNFNLTTGAKYNEWWVNNFYEYGYKDMKRNDDTMHPYTYVDTSLTRNTSQLDYNTYDFSDSRKYKEDLYKTNITREDDFDL